MLREMLAGSWAVLTRPRAETFQEREKDDFGAGLLYAALSAFVSAVAAGLLYWLAEAFGPETSVAAATSPLTGAGTLAAAAMIAFVATLVLFSALVGLLYVIGRGMGGQGSLGELAYDVALYWAPLAVLRTIVNQLAELGLGAIAGLLQLAVLGYTLFLAWHAIQAGMDLDARRAGGVILGVAAVLAAAIVCGALAVTGVDLLLGGAGG